MAKADKRDVEEDQVCEDIDGISASMSLVAIEEYLESTTENDLKGNNSVSGTDKVEENVVPLCLQIAHDRSKKQRSLDVQATGKEAGISFQDLQLRESTVLGLKKCGFHEPSPIQLKAIPLGKFGYDLILQSKSGTGKTCAFSVLILEQLDLGNLFENIQALILAPTREIACQNADVVKGIGCKTSGLLVKSFIGGTAVDQSIRRSKACHIASGSPGRVLHMINDGQMDLSNLQIIVLDEADKLMESPFLTDVVAIFAALPATKQVIAASATYPDGLKDFVKRFMNHPMEIAANIDPALLAIELYAADVHKILDKTRSTNWEVIFDNKIKVLLELLRNLQFTQAVVFCKCLMVDKVYDVLKEYDFDVGRLSGTLQQRDRLIALRHTQQGKCQILISSDLGARGIDCEGVNLVINFEPPDDVVTFVHRTGRAGRFGSPGICVTLMTFGSDFYALADFTRKMKFDIKVLQTVNQIQSLDNGQAKKLERLRVKGTTASINDAEYENWKVLQDFLMKTRPYHGYPSSQLDTFASFKLNVDFNASWAHVGDIKRRSAL